MKIEPKGLLKTKGDTVSWWHEKQYTLVFETDPFPPNTETAKTSHKHTCTHMHTASPFLLLLKKGVNKDQTTIPGVVDPFPRPSLGACHSKQVDNCRLSCGSNWANKPGDRQCFPKLIPHASGSRSPRGKRKKKVASVEGITKALGTREGLGL